MAKSVDNKDYKVLIDKRFQNATKSYNLVLTAKDKTKPSIALKSNKRELHALYCKPTETKSEFESKKMPSKKYSNDPDITWSDVLSTNSNYKTLPKETQKKIEKYRCEIRKNQPNIQEKKAYNLQDERIKKKSAKETTCETEYQPIPHLRLKNKKKIPPRLKDIQEKETYKIDNKLPNHYQEVHSVGL